MTITLIYFSPTKTTKKVVEKIAEGYDPEQKTEIINLTQSNIRNKTHSINGKLCIIGAPCYEARIPPLVREALRKINGNNIPAIAVVLYGNRTIGVSVKELVGILDEQDFCVIGTGTFIGEHSYASEKLPMALGRPNADDLGKAMEFGQKIKSAGLDQKPLSEEMIPGKIKTLFKLIPEGFLGSFGEPSAIDTEKCTKCGTCVKLCPTNAIDDESLDIDSKLCINCMACVKLCPEGARVVEFKMKALVKKFMSAAVTSKREPKCFLSEEIYEKK